MPYGIGKGVHVVGTEEGVETCAYDETAVGRVHQQCGAQPVVAAEGFDGSRSGDDLLARCGAQTLVLSAIH